jgi:hypothetical protein
MPTSARSAIVTTAGSILRNDITPRSEVLAG